MGRRKNKVRKYLEEIKSKYNTHLYNSLNDSSKKELLNKLYHIENLSMSDVSECIGKSHKNSSWFRQFSIEKKSKELELKEPSRNIRTPRNMLVPLSEICDDRRKIGSKTYYRNKETKKWFTLRRGSPNSRNPREYVYYHEVDCSVCGSKMFKHDTIKNGDSQNYCSKECKVVGQSGERSSNWRGGRWSNQYGYVLCPLPLNHPNRVRGRSTILEHRLIVEQELGRHLTKKDVVHHKDLNKQNNSLDNLLLTNNSEHLAIHNSLDRCARYFLKLGMIRFNNETRRYEVTNGEV